MVREKRIRYNLNQRNLTWDGRGEFLSGELSGRSLAGLVSRLPGLDVI